MLQDHAASIPDGGIAVNRFSNFPATNDTGLETGGAVSADYQVAAGKEDDPHVSIETHFTLHLFLHVVVLSPEKVPILRAGL